MAAENHEDCRRAIHDPAVVRAMLEDHRAGLGVDRAADEEDMRLGRRVSCPTLVLWASRDDMGLLYGDPLDVWRPWTLDLRGRRIDSGHHLGRRGARGTRPADHVVPCGLTAMTIGRQEGMLVVVSGLPGTGKSVIAEGLGKALGVPILSVDPIESAVLRAGLAQASRPDMRPTWSLRRWRTRTCAWASGA
jgi:hypothetical protein